MTVRELIISNMDYSMLEKIEIWEKGKDTLRLNPLEMGKSGILDRKVLAFNSNHITIEQLKDRIIHVQKFKCLSISEFITKRFMERS